MIDIKKYSVTAIGNAMLDLVCEVPEQFLSKERISKGVMNLVSRERSNNILKLVRPIKELREDLQPIQFQLWQS